MRRRVLAAGVRRHARHDSAALARGRAKDPVVANEVEARRGDEGNESLDELPGLEDDVGRAVAPAVLQAVQEPPALEAREALRRDGRPGHVAAEALEALTVAGRHRDVRVQAHAARARAALAFERGEIFGIDAVTDAQHAPSRAGPAGDAAGDGSSIELG